MGSRGLVGVGGGGLARWGGGGGEKGGARRLSWGFRDPQ